MLIQVRVWDEAHKEWLSCATGGEAYSQVVYTRSLDFAMINKHYSAFVDAFLETEDPLGLDEIEDIPDLT